MFFNVKLIFKKMEIKDLIKKVCPLDTTEGNCSAWVLDFSKKGESFYLCIPNSRCLCPDLLQEVQKPTTG